MDTVRPRQHDLCRRCTRRTFDREHNYCMACGHSDGVHMWQPLLTLAVGAALIGLLVWLAN